MKQRKHTSLNAQKPHLQAIHPVTQDAVDSLGAAATGSSENLVRASAPRLRETPLNFPQDVHKFDVSGSEYVHPQKPAYEDLGELPHAYGTRRLFLAARDPYYLFAYWDFTHEQLVEEAWSKAHDHQTFLQVYRSSSERIAQVRIEYTPSSYIFKVEPNHSFYAEIGFYNHNGSFEVLARSNECHTPRENLSPYTEARFITIPFDFSFRQLLDLIQAYILPNEELADALARLQLTGFEFPFETFAQRYISPAASHELLHRLPNEWVKKIRLGSIDISEIVRGRIFEALSSERWARPQDGLNLTSPVKRISNDTPSDFWMKLNAELIIYGATDPKAVLKIDGQPITLQQDGSFRYHFKFPDGTYQLPIEAESTDGRAKRHANLSFVRSTDAHPTVGPMAQPDLPNPMILKFQKH